MMTSLMRMTIKLRMTMTDDGGGGGDDEHENNDRTNKQKY